MAKRIKRRKINNNRPLTLSARVVCMLVASVMGMGMTSVRAAQPGAPSLVVSIVVDGMSMETIDRLRAHLNKGGFKQLLEQGVVMPRVDYGTYLDAAAATAVLYTGAAPKVNGIGGETRFDPETRRVVMTLHDPQVMGNATDLTLSAAPLRSSTIADELRIATGGLGYAYAIAPDPSQAVIMAGHAGNSGVWINDIDGRWSSTTYYTELPTPVTTVNRLNPLSARLDTLVWKPSIDMALYTDLPSFKRLYPFRQSFSCSDRDRYRSYKVSACVNSDVTDMAGDYLRNLNLGRHEGTDMLSLAYTLQPYTYGSDPDTRAELTDSYLRFDGELGRLLKMIETSGPGLDNTVIVVSGTPINSTSRADDPKWRIPSGNFSPRRAASLLNMYLIALHGNGDWVAGIHGSHVYLNTSLIKQRDKNLALMQEQTAEFMTRLSGVASAMTVSDMLNDVPDSPSVRNMFVADAGDVCFALMPGWSVSDEEPTPGGRKTVERAYAVTTAPAFILAPGVVPATVGETVDARAIAPTVSSILRIRSPNAAAQPAVSIKR